MKKVHLQYELPTHLHLEYASPDQRAQDILLLLQSTGIMGKAI